MSPCTTTNSSKQQRPRFPLAQRSASTASESRTLAETLSLLQRLRRATSWKSARLRLLDGPSTESSASRLTLRLAKRSERLGVPWGLRLLGKLPPKVAGLVSFHRYLYEGPVTQVPFSTYGGPSWGLYLGRALTAAVSLLLVRTDAHSTLRSVELHVQHTGARLQGMEHKPGLGLGPGVEGCAVLRAMQET